MLFTNKQTDKPSLPKTQPPLFICLYSLKLNDNKHSRFCKVTHTRDFHGLQLVRDYYPNNLNPFCELYYILGKGAGSDVSIASICLSYLSVSNITQQVMNRLQYKFTKGFEEL